MAKSNCHAGYAWEYEVMKRRELRGICERLAKNQLADLIAFDMGNGISYLIECKSTKKKKWYPSARERLQFSRLWEVYLKISASKVPQIFKVIYEIKEDGKRSILELPEVRLKYFSKMSL